MGVVEEQIVIERPSEEVWNVLADFGHVHRWSPVVTHSEATNEVEGGVGCERSCAVAGFGSITERATGWDEGRSIDVVIEGAPMMHEMAATQTLEPLGPQREHTTVTMRVEYRPGLGPLGAVMGATMMRWVTRRNIRRTLEGLRQYVEAGASIDAVSPQVEREGEL